MKENKIFIGCNYRNKKQKVFYDAYKLKIEQKYPLNVVLIDKQKKRKADDLWVEIKREIDDSCLVIFDVSAFRPNVILELGYAIKERDSSSEIIICFFNRSKGGKEPPWELSDIGHLYRQTYKTDSELEKYLDKQIDQMPFVARVNGFYESCNRTTAPQKYVENGNKILLTLRDKAAISKTELKDIMKGSACREVQMTDLLTGSSLMKRQVGKYGKYFLNIEKY